MYTRKNRDNVGGPKWLREGITDSTEWLGRHVDTFNKDLNILVEQLINGKVTSIGRFAETANWGVVGGAITGGIHQVAKNGWDPRNWNGQDVGLAVLTGAVLGGAVDLRRRWAGESVGKAFRQVGFNVVATSLTTNDPSDLYIAAIIGSSSIPIVGAVEKRFPNQEPLTNAVMGSVFASTQYATIQAYNGDPIATDSLVINALGGFVGPGGFKAGSKHILPDRYRNVDDFIVAGGGSFTGGFLIPYTLEQLRDKYTEN